MEDFSSSQAKAAVSYSGTDMNWMMFHGEDDGIFIPDESEDLYNSVFEKLEIEDTIIYDVIKSDTDHVTDPSFFYVMMNFVRDGEVTKVSDYDDDFAGRLATLGMIATLVVLGA